MQNKCKGSASLQENVRLGKKLATGGFGTVYRADLVDEETGEEREVIVKKVRASWLPAIHTACLQPT